MNKFLIVSIILAAGFYFLYPRETPAPISTYPVVSSSEPITQPTSSNFSCDGRTHCSQMTSCAEAKYFIQHCPNTQMDGNNDGVPCEKQWCHWAQFCAQRTSVNFALVEKWSIWSRPFWRVQNLSYPKRGTAKLTLKKSKKPWCNHQSFLPTGNAQSIIIIAHFYSSYL